MLRKPSALRTRGFRAVRICGPAEGQRRTKFGCCAGGSKGNRESYHEAWHSSALRPAAQLSRVQRDEVVGAVLTTAKKIGFAVERTSALSTLADQVNGERREELISDALAAAKQIGPEDSRVFALRPFANRWSKLLDARDEVIGEALATAKACASEFARAFALSGLASQLSGEQLGEALAVAKAIGSEFARASALSASRRSLERGATSRSVQRVSGNWSSSRLGPVLSLMVPFMPALAEIGGERALQELGERSTILRFGDYSSRHGDDGAITSASAD